MSKVLKRFLWVLGAERRGTRRCLEYEHLIPQIPYLLPEVPEVMRIFMAWADLYISLREVAPTFQSLGAMKREWALFILEEVCLNS